MERNSVVANFATTAADGKTYQVEHYNLDVIISVGYRVKSKRGTQFRIWASNVLRQYLVEGYALNQKRLLEQQQAQMNKLQQAIRMISEMPERTELSNNEAASILKVLQEYSYALDILSWLGYSKTRKCFGNDKDVSFESSLESIKHSFGNKHVFNNALMTLILMSVKE